MDDRAKAPAPLDPPQRAAAAFNLGIAATIMSAMGFVWLCWGWGSVDSFTFVDWIPLYLATIILGTVAVRTFRKGNALMTLHGGRRDQFWTEHGQQFKVITALEGTGCALVVLLAVHFHHSGLIASGIALVVGVHFLPLAKVLNFPAYLFVGMAIIACAVLSVLLFRDEGSTAMAGIGTGGVLWVTALYALRRFAQFDLPWEA